MLKKTKVEIKKKTTCPSQRKKKRKKNMADSCSLDCFHYPRINAKTVFFGTRNVPNSVGACRFERKDPSSNGVIPEYKIKRTSLLLCDEKDNQRMKGAHALGATVYLVLGVCLALGAFYMKKRDDIKSNGRVYLVIAAALATVASAFQWVRVATVPSCKYTDKTVDRECPSKVIPCKKSHDHVWVESASEGELKRFNYMSKKQFSELYPDCEFSFQK